MGPCFISSLNFCINHVATTRGTEKGKVMAQKSTHKQHAVFRIAAGFAVRHDSEPNKRAIHKRHRKRQTFFRIVAAFTGHRCYYSDKPKTKVALSDLTGSV